MEYSVWLSELSDINKISNQYSRIYYGNAYCPRAQFKLEEVKRVLELCDQTKKSITFVTSYMTEESMEQLIPILDYVRGCQNQSELVINDWGLLNYIKDSKYQEFRLILGALLNKMKKSPMIGNIFLKLSEDAKSSLQSASSNFTPVWRLYQEYGITGVEFENVIQENQIQEDFPFQKILLYPYVLISNARRCMTDRIMSNRKEYDYTTCGSFCKETEFILYNKVLCRDVILHGGTFLYENQDKPSNMEQYSRIVIQKNFLNHKNIEK